jgi:hypothetical protein
MHSSCRARVLIAEVVRLGLWRLCRDVDEGGLEEEQDDAELNAATFGDAAAEEDSVLWDNVAVASEAMKAGQSAAQPRGGPVFDAQLQHMLHATRPPGGDEAGGKRQWLPQGNGERAKPCTCPPVRARAGTRTAREHGTECTLRRGRYAVGIHHR